MADDVLVVNRNASGGEEKEYDLAAIAKALQTLRSLSQENVLDIELITGNVGDYPEAVKNAVQNYNLLHRTLHQLIGATVDIVQSVYDTYTDLEYFKIM